MYINPFAALFDPKRFPHVSTLSLQNEEDIVYDCKEFKPIIKYSGGKQRLELMIDLETIFEDKETNTLYFSSVETGGTAYCFAITKKEDVYSVSSKSQSVTNGFETTYPLLLTPLYEDG